jgi:hypothetical protein
MKRGIKHMALPNPPVGAPQLGEVCGIPVRYQPQSKHMADARGVWPVKWIAVGPMWFTLTPREQQAVLYHEVWHCLALHMEKRLLGLPLFWTRWVREWAYNQEFDADEFAVAHGYGVELREVIKRHSAAHDPHLDPFHPHPQQRVLRLQKMIRELNHAFAA